MVPSPLKTRLLVSTLACCVAACGGGGGAGTGPTPITSPSPTGGHSVQVVVFYDENADGQGQPGELARVPNVEVSISSRTARSAPGTGIALLEHVPAGTHPVVVRPDSLPPFYRVGAPVTTTIPLGEGSRVFVPLTLPIGSREPNTYLAFGDSLTRGEGLTPDARYPAQLQSRLGPHFAQAFVSNRGADGTSSTQAIERLSRNLEPANPAYALILYGTNDWNEPDCQTDPACKVVPNLRTVVQAVKKFGSLPVIATLPPVNPTLNPAERNAWIRDVNERIKTMAREEGALLADPHKTISDRGGDLSRFFLDHVHLNGEGASLVAEAFFQAIAFGRGAPPTTAGRFLLLAH